VDGPATAAVELLGCPSGSGWANSSIYTIYLSILVTPVVWAELLGCPYGASSWSGWINEEFRVFSMYDITKFIEVHLTRNGRHESSSGPTKSRSATSDNRQHVGP
jgi:hypothetical protein